MLTKPRTRHAIARDQKYLDWLVEEHPYCAVDNEDCFGDIIAAHSVGRKGTAVKATDYAAFGLCFGHHNEQEQIGHKSFAKKYDLNYWEIAFRLYHEYTTGVPV